MGFLPFSIAEFVRAVGYIGIFAIVFAETGLLVGFFLPGDSLLFTAGFMASQGRLEIAILIAVCFLAALLGDGTGYWIGKRWGRRLFQSTSRGFFRREHLEKAETFFARHGGKAIVLARFLGIIRTFTPVVAGAAKMHYLRFSAYNAVGALLWTGGTCFTGYKIGRYVPGLGHLLLPVFALVIAISLIPTLFSIVTQAVNSRARA